MITINDLKLTIDFWKWLCGLTEDYLIFKHHEYVWIENKKTGERRRITKDDELNEQNPITLKNTIESIIYQAIDGLNDLFLLHRNEDGFYEIMQSSGILIIQKSMIYSCAIPVHDVEYNNYENKTTARLAALQWIFNQGARNDTI